MAKTATGEAHRLGRRETTPSAPPRRKPARGRNSAPCKAARYWSARVTKESDALDLEGGVFSLKDPKRIAASLKRSAERSRRRKAEPYRSALSMLSSISTAPARSCRPAGAARWSGRRASYAGSLGGIARDLRDRKAALR